SAGANKGNDSVNKGIDNANNRIDIGVNQTNGFLNKNVNDAANKSVDNLNKNIDKGLDNLQGKVTLPPPTFDVNPNPTPSLASQAPMIPNSAAPALPAPITGNNNSFPM